MDIQNLIIAILLCLVVWLYVLGRIRRGRGHRRAVKRARRASAGEVAAEELLESHGYAVLDRQVRCLWWMEVDGEDEDDEELMRQYIPDGYDDDFDLDFDDALDFADMLDALDAVPD